MKEGSVYLLPGKTQVIGVCMAYRYVVAWVRQRAGWLSEKQKKKKKKKKRKKVNGAVSSFFAARDPTQHSAVNTVVVVASRRTKSPAGQPPSHEPTCLLRGESISVWFITGRLKSADSRAEGALEKAYRL